MRTAWELGGVRLSGKVHERHEPHEWMRALEVWGLLHLSPQLNRPASAALRAAETTGRPLGNAAFIDGLERILGRRLARGRPGPAPKPAPDIAQRALWG